MENVTENPYQGGVPIMADGRPATRQNSAKPLVVDPAFGTKAAPPGCLVECEAASGPPEPELRRVMKRLANETEILIVLVAEFAKRLGPVLDQKKATGTTAAPRPEPAASLLGGLLDESCTKVHDARVWLNDLLNRLVI